MRDKIEKNIQAQSYTSILDHIFGSMPCNNISHRNQLEFKINQPVNNTKQEPSEDKKKFKIKEEGNAYITKEKYHGLNKNISHHNSIIRSTSTIFCDLDDIAKRYSFHCIAEVSVSNDNILKVMKLPVNSGFEGKSDAIVQECATQIQPKLLVKDSLDLKSSKNKFLHNDILSSEIFLRDPNGFVSHSRKNQYFNIDVTNHQKFWSYAKYRSDFTKPSKETKKSKKKEKNHELRVEDPCPCQLFSYACPCVDENSHHEADKVENFVTVNQVTSTADAKKKKPKHDTRKEDKPTNTIVVEKIDVVIEPKNGQINKNHDENPIPKLPERSISKNRSSSIKKLHKIVCPNCNEKVETVSITEEEPSLSCDFRYESRDSKEIPSTAAYNCSTASTKPVKNKNEEDDEDKDVCRHDPRCELIPLCQILPTDELYVNQKCTKKSSPKPTHPRTIRITKACRHHPPCTVVPSCQRANVLRNNCEFIPPCLHRPRCVNLPLCVPLAKSIHYEDPSGVLIDDDDAMQCAHNPKVQVMHLCHHDSLTNNAEHQYYGNACQYFHDQYDYDFVRPSLKQSPIYPCAMSPTDSPKSFKSHKSCQFCSNCNKCEPVVAENPNNTVMYVRDVGCQFKSTKPYSPKDSVIQAKSSSALFDRPGKPGKCNYTVMGAPTIRYRDTSTNAMKRSESITSDSFASTEVDLNCPSHGYRALKGYSGFQPRAAFVTAYAEIESKNSDEVHVNKKLTKHNASNHRETFAVKSRRSFLKGRYRKIFSSKRRRHSKGSTSIKHFHTNELAVAE